MNYTAQVLRPQFERAQQRMLVVGTAGVLLLIVGLLFSSRQFFQSYLFAYIFWISFPLGCFGILMLHHMVSGRWGFVIQRFLEASAKTLPLMALLFLPILFGIKEIYPWTSLEPSHTPGEQNEISCC